MGQHSLASFLGKVRAGGRNLLDVFYYQTEVTSNCQLMSATVYRDKTYKQKQQGALPSTMTMRLRNPKKLGVSVVSWLRQDGFDAEWTASTWRYFLRNAFFNSSVAPVEPLAIAFALVVVVSLSWAETWTLWVTPLLCPSKHDPADVEVAVFIL
jgi:hypothetical protein